MPSPPRPAWRSKRPAPRSAAGAPTPITDQVIWTREVSPRERYRLRYVGSDEEESLREIELLRVGTFSGATYFGVLHLGRFKTFRGDRIMAVEQLSEGHAPSIRAYPAYPSVLPPFPLANAVYRVPTVAGNRTWKVDLNLYTCACPERRVRSALGYEPGQLGFVCPHLARAILDYLPKSAPGWTPELLDFLANPRKVHLDNLVSL